MRKTKTWGWLQWLRGSAPVPLPPLLRGGGRRYNILDRFTSASDGNRSLGLINGKTLSAGESAAVSVKPGTLTIKCFKIEKESVLITVEGEDASRFLHLR
jgi:hypothetical protein